jgi:uncharacterized damage-inducible protein DinB
MNVQNQMRTLFDYHWHTTRRMLAAAAALPADELTAHPGYGLGSIHEILFHVLRTDRNWRIAVETGRQANPITLEQFPDLATLEQGYAEEEAAWTALLAGLTEEHMVESLELTNWRGEALAIPRWRIFQHLALHGMQHHSELAHLLTHRGQSPGDIDFILYH